MKHLKLLAAGPTRTSEHLIMDISQKEERWRMNISATAPGQLELYRITFDLHNGSTWSGNVQDLAAIQAYAMNALDFINKYIPRDISECVMGVDCSNELDQLLSHFSKTS